MLRRLYRHLENSSAHGAPDRFLAANLALGLGHFLVLFNGGAYLPMIPRIIGALGCNPLYGSWSQDLYFLFLGLGSILGRWVSQRFGDRDGLLFSLAVFFLASLVNASTRAYAPFLLARMVSGWAGGLSIPLSLNILLRHYHSDRRGRGLFLWGLAAITPFALGPYIGGWIADTWGWRWLFILNMPILLLSFLGVWLWEPQEARDPSAPMDWLGYILLILSLSTLEMLFNLGSKEDWFRSSTICLLGGLAVILAVSTALWLRKQPMPAVHLQSLRHGNLRVAALGIFLTALVFQGTLALFIVQYQLSFGYSARAIGDLLLSMAVFAPLSAVFSHWFLERHDPRTLAVAAMVLLGVASLWLSSYDLPASPSSVGAPPLLVGLGLGGAFAAWARIGLWGLSGPAERQAAALLNLLRSSGQAMGIPLVTALWERRLDLHRHFLVEIGASHRELWQAAIKRMNASTPSMARLVHLHAAMLAFNEIFYVAGWIFLALALWSLLARAPTQKSPETAAEQMAIAELVEP